MTEDKAALKVVEGRFENLIPEMSKFVIKDKDGILHSAVYSANWADKMARLKVGYWGRVTLEQRGGPNVDVWEMMMYEFMQRPAWAPAKAPFGGAPTGAAPATGGQTTFTPRPSYGGSKAPSPEMLAAMAKKDRLIAIESALKSAVELGIAMKPKGTFEEVFDACVEAAIRAAEKMDKAASK